MPFLVLVVSCSPYKVLKTKKNAWKKLTGKREVDFLKKIKLPKITCETQKSCIFLNIFRCKYIFFEFIGKVVRKPILQCRTVLVDVSSVRGRRNGGKGPWPPGF